MRAGCAQLHPSSALIGSWMAGDPRRLFIGQETATWSQPRGAGLPRGAPAFAARMRGRLRATVQVRQILAERHFRPCFPVRPLMGGGGKSALVDTDEPAMKLVSSTSFRFESQSLPMAPGEASACVCRPRRPHLPAGGGRCAPHADSRRAGVPAQAGAPGTDSTKDRAAAARDKEDAADVVGRGRVR